MPARLDWEDEKRILKLYFQGFKQKEIAAQVNVSDRNIRGRIRVFRLKVDKEGLKTAALNMELKIDALYGLAKYQRETGQSFDDINEGIKTALASKKLGCNPLEINKFLDLVCKEIMDIGYSPQDFVLNAYMLKDAREKLGKPYEQAVNEHASMVEKLAETEVSIKVAKEAREKAIEGREKALANWDTTETQLREYNETRDSLKIHGVELDEAEKLATLLDNIQPHIEDPRGLVEYYTQTKDAETRHRETLQDVETLEKSLSELTRENSELESKIDEKHSMYIAAQTLEETGITPTQAMTLSLTVKQIAAKHGTPKSKAFGKLSRDLNDHYDAALGFETHYTRLQTQVASTDRIFKELQSSHSRLLEENRNQINTVKNLQTLNSQGVGNQDIVEWTMILDENNLDSHTLRREIKKLGGIKQTTAKLTENNNILTNNITKLETENARLEARQRQLNTIVEQLENTVPENLSMFAGQLTDLINKLDKEILSPETGIKPRTNTLVQETVDHITQTLQNYDIEWTKHLQTLTSIIEESAETVSRLEEKTYEAGKIIGQVNHLESVLKLFQDKQLTYNESNITVIGLAVSLQNHLNKKGMPRSTEKIQEFIQTFSNEVIHIA